MHFSQEALAKFKAIYAEDYGIALTDEEALSLATSFFNLMKAVYTPLPDEICISSAGTVS